MKRYTGSLLAISLTFLIGCGGGGSDSEDTSTPSDDNNPTAENLSKTTLVYSDSPSLNKEFTLTIKDNVTDAPSDYSWEITSQPATSNLQLNVSADKKSSSLIPTIAGLYKIIASSSAGNSVDTQFLIATKLPFDETKLEGFDSSIELSKQAGIVLNQVWLYSKTLTQAALQSIVANYNSFNVIGFDKVRGLLLEFDDTTTQSLTDINALKSTSGVDSIDPRVFVGNDFEYALLKIPDDGSAFDDGGDNWQLESIEATKAWDITTGSSDFFIGITDGGYSPQHEDLRGRFKESIDNDLDIEHGTGVAGAIAAISDNKKGISGINWSNQLIANGLGFDALNNIMSKDGVLLSNNSWSLIPNSIARRFNPDSANSVEEITRISLAQTGDYRKLADEFPTKLFVFGAGNGIANGQGNSNGVFGVDGLYGSPALHYEDQDGEAILSKKDNVMFVAAHLRDSKLPYYSNYGESVDIAAPSHFKSTKRNSDPFEAEVERDEYFIGDEYGANNISSAGFAGTSAAAPLVTGVASLIFAVDPKLSAADVKTILISSATNVIAERYIQPLDENGEAETEILDNAIPRLNAASALTMTKEIVDAKVIVVDHSFSSPFSSIVNVNVATANEDIQIQSFDYAINVRNNGALEELFSGTNAGFSPLVFQNLDPDKTNYIVSGTTQMPAHEPTGISLNSDFSYEFIVPKVKLLSSDKTTQAPIPNVSIDIKADDDSFPLTSGTTDSNGSSRLFLTSGKYSIIAKADGYDDLTQSFSLKNTDLELDVILELEPNTSNPNPTPGANGENLKPITPLTNSETFTIPNTTNIPGFSSITVTDESGFEGSIDQGLNLVQGVNEINAVEIQRDIGISVVCESDTKPVTLNESDFSNGSITETFYDNGQQVESCSSNYQSILPITLTNSNLNTLEDWGSEDQLSTNCPTGNTSTTEPPFQVENSCDSVITTNYLITDVNGVEHKISLRTTAITNE